MQNTTSPAALIALAIKAHPEMTEAEIAAAIDARLTIARQIADAKCTVYEYMMASLIASQKETRSRLRQVEAERDALASWQCQTCGARFAEAVAPGLTDGVRQCSGCVLLEVLVTKRAEAEERALIASKTYDEQQSSYRDLEAQYSEATNQRQAAEHRLAVVITTIIQVYMAMFPTWEYVSPQQALEVIKREYLILAAKAAKDE